MITLPAVTDRLTLRMMRPPDAPAFAAYRSDPEIARYQSWAAPYPMAAAEALIAEQAALTGPAPGRWVQLAIEVGGELAGDVAVHVDEQARVAEVGYTIAPEHQGRGIATEATAMVVDALLAAGVHRVEAGVDPQNLASRRVLERIGFRREGLARQAFLSQGTWTDDERWALLDADRTMWLARPTGPAAEVRLVELGPDVVRTYARLEVHPSQDGSVASVYESYADALVVDTDDRGGLLVPWFRGVAADGEPAGFVMLAEPTPTNPVPYLWRLLIDRRHQGRGIGRRIVDLLAERYRSGGHHELLTSWVPGPGGPEGFYAQLGFEPTGEVDDGEVVGRLVL